MKHIWTVLCQKSSIDVETNLVSLFNCIEELDLVIDKIKAPSGNLVIPVEFQLVSFWTIENPNKDSLLEIKIELIDPVGKVLNGFENKYPIKKGILRFRNRTNIKGMPITNAGRYVIKIMQRAEGKKQFEDCAELPLDIKIAYKLIDANEAKK